MKRAQLETLAHRLGSHPDPQVREDTGLLLAEIERLRRNERVMRGSLTAERNDLAIRLAECQRTGR
jgi:hypothetical protein